MTRKMGRSIGILAALAALSLGTGCATKDVAAREAGAGEATDIETRLDRIEAAAMEAQQAAQAAKLEAEEANRKVDRAFEHSQQK